MVGQLIPPPDLDTRSEKPLTMGQRISAWFDLCAFGEAFWLAGIQRRIGKAGDMRAAVREKLEKEAEARDKKVRHLLTELERRETADGG